MKKYKVLFDSFPLGIAITDKEGNFVECNKEGEKILEVTKESVTELNIRDGNFMDSNRNPLPVSSYAAVRALEDNKLVKNQEAAIIKDKLIWLSMTAAPIPLENYGIAVAYKDITERKIMDEELKNHRFHLEELVKKSN